MKTFTFFITCAPFHEGLLLEEIKNLGINEAKETHLGVSFTGTLKDAYTVLLWSRLAHHLLLKLKDFRATNQHALYNEIKKINWSEHINPTGTFRIDILGKHTQFTHPHYLVQVAKDAIVDQLREQFNERPNIEKDTPDVVLTIKAKNEDCQLYIDLSGESLHLRGYRRETGPTPLKETLAAALLIRAGWPKRLETANPILLDPMCGSGTILIEAAMMAYDIAPGLLRSYFGCLKWLLHDKKLWDGLIQEAKTRKAQGLTRQDIHLIGYDQHPAALIFATDAAKRLGVESRIILEKRDLTQLALPPNLPAAPGLIVTNPPYGVRLLKDDPEAVRKLFETLGERLREPEFHHWEAYIITGEREPVKALGIRRDKSYRFKNGDLECELLQFHIVPERFWRADFR
jgi:23S rRNA (guanine2445-N2)-methyltransferase / 23S rRNA (guanine2069-N7)-methyltransferase